MTVSRFFVSSLIVIAAATSAFAENRDFMLDVKEFTELKVNNPLNVEYRCSADSAGRAFFSCPPEVAENLIFTNNKGKLSIEIDFDQDMSVPMPTVRVYSSMLTSVENGSDSTVRVVTNAPVKNFKAKLIGNGTLTVDTVEAESVEAKLITGHGTLSISGGTAFKASLSNVGTGSVQAGGLRANQVKVFLSGTGGIDCCAVDQLTIYGMGSGSVYYSGNPSKVSNRSMGVKAHPIK